MALVRKRLQKVLRLDRKLCRADGFGVPATGMPPKALLEFSPVFVPAGARWGRAACCSHPAFGQV